jgi:hypothetical protein
MSTAATPASQPKLDDLMLAMDVVDTIRHREDVLQRELNLGDSDDALIDRLKTIYREQGIEVSERVLREGVTSLKAKRFEYKAPPPGLLTGFFRLYIRRGRIGATLGAALLAVAVAVGGYYFGIARPAADRAESARIELAETLPAALAAEVAAATAASQDPAANRRIGDLRAAGEQALRNADAAGAREAVASLKALTAELNRTYELRIVLREGVYTRVWRVPARNPQGRNNYIVVEAFAPNGQKLTLPIRSEEDGSVREVDIFAVRVPRSTYDAVGRDRDDDGIIQNAVIGEKPRGRLDVTYRMPAEGGFITAW